jgi:hypothetical protein
MMQSIRPDANPLPDDEQETLPFITPPLRLRPAEPRAPNPEPDRRRALADETHPVSPFKRAGRGAPVDTVKLTGITGNEPINALGGGGGITENVTEKPEQPQGIPPQEDATPRKDDTLIPGWKGHQLPDPRTTTLRRPTGDQPLTAPIKDWSARVPSNDLLDTSEIRMIDSKDAWVFSAGMQLRLDIEGASEPKVISPKTETIFGRGDPNAGTLPDIDLTPYEGYRLGVSRRHATLHLEDQRLILSDLGSSNGTFLNSMRLTPHRPYQLRSGDELRLGQLNMRLRFLVAEHKPEKK